MIIQQITRTDADKVFINIDNGEGATLPSGAAVIWHTGTDANGLLIRQPDTAKLFGFIGCLDASIASVTGSYGLVQCFGYKSNAIVFQTDTSIPAGVELIAVAGQNYLQSVVTTTASNAAVTQQPIRAILAASVASSTASATISVGVYIQAM